MEPRSWLFPAARGDDREVLPMVVVPAGAAAYLWSPRQEVAVHIAILGTGQVGRQLGSKLVAEGHTVTLGSRTADNAAGAAWAAETGGRVATFADAARAADVVLNCIGGQNTLAALEAAGAENLAGKVLIDVSNPLDFSNGFPPTLSVCNTDSLAERIQRAHPGAKVVKALNTVSNHLMVDPGALAGGDHTLLICGDDDGAKAQVAGWMREWFGWSDVLDGGPLHFARGQEAWLLMWTRLYGKLGTANFSMKIVR